MVKRSQATSQLAVECTLLEAVRNLTTVTSQIILLQKVEVWVLNFMGTGRSKIAYLSTNDASIYGGGFYQSSGGQNDLGEEVDTTFSNCLFDTNQASSGGGGTYMYYSEARFEDCTMLNNDANSYGDGMSGYGFSGCEFLGTKYSSAITIC